MGVAPCVGAWIEMQKPFCICHYKNLVAPCVGAWIEMLIMMCSVFNAYVAPCVGAWIEILFVLW